MKDIIHFPLRSSGYKRGKFLSGIYYPLKEKFEEGLNFYLSQKSNEKEITGKLLSYGDMLIGYKNRGVEDFIGCSISVMYEYFIGLQYAYSQKNGRDVQSLFFYDVDDEICLEHFTITRNAKTSEVDLGMTSAHLDLDYVIQSDKELAQKGQYFMDNQEIFDRDGYQISEYLSPTIRTPENLQRAKIIAWAFIRQKREKEFPFLFTEETDILAGYLKQKELQSKIKTYQDLPESIRYIALARLKYSELELKLTAIVDIKNADTLEKIETLTFEQTILFPYIPDLHSFKDAEIISKALKKATVKIDLLLVKGQGVNHPCGIGVASHLGAKYNLPAIAYDNKRIIGFYDEEVLGKAVGSRVDLSIGEDVVSAAVRTKENSDPVFVAVGHRVDLDTAVHWVLKTREHLTYFFRHPNGKIVREFDYMGDRDRSELYDDYLDVEKLH